MHGKKSDNDFDAKECKLLGQIKFKLTNNAKNNIRGTFDFTIVESLLPP